MSYESESALKTIEYSYRGVRGVCDFTLRNAGRLVRTISYLAKEGKNTEAGKKIYRVKETGSHLKIICVKDNELKRFCREMNRAGIEFSVIKDEQDLSDVCAILIDEKHSGRVSRLFERCKFTKVRTRNDILYLQRKKDPEKDKCAKENEKENAEDNKDRKEEPEINESGREDEVYADDKVDVKNCDEIKSIRKSSADKNLQNPTDAPATELRSENFSEIAGDDVSFIDERVSVRKELKAISKKRQEDMEKIMGHQAMRGREKD